MICKLQFCIELIKKMVQVPFPKNCFWIDPIVVDVDDNFINLIGCWCRMFFDNLIMYCSCANACDCLCLIECMNATF